jgi:hypothetical protein
VLAAGAKQADETVRGAPQGLSRSLWIMVWRGGVMGVPMQRIATGRLFPVAVLATTLFSVAPMPRAFGADTFPSRPIRIIVSSAPGSGPDVIARLLGPSLTAVLGQSVVVDNPPVPAAISAVNWRRMRRPTAIRC